MQGNKLYWCDFSTNSKMSVLFRLLITGNYHLIDEAEKQGRKKELNEKRNLLGKACKRHYPDKVKEEIASDIWTIISELINNSDEDSDYHEVAKRIRDYEYMNKHNISLFYEEEKGF